MLVSRATNVWIKFTPYVNDMWKKRVFEVFSSTGKYMKSVGVSMRISHLREQFMNI